MNHILKIIFSILFAYFLIEFLFKSCNDFHVIDG